jgi:hypothetical protein
MSETTGTLYVRDRGVVLAYPWNGNVDDREAARAAFDAFTTAGSFIAVAFDSTVTRKGSRVETFEEVERIERERGTVVVQVTRALVGG